MSTPSDDLEHRLAALTARVYDLEQRLDQLREERNSSSATPGDSKVESVRSPALTAKPPASPPFSPAAPLVAAPAQSLESRVGSQWFNRIGIIALLIGVAWFLKFAFENHWIGPLGRVLIGLLGGVALIVWSERFRRHGYPPFSYSLKALGGGILYLSLWAAFAEYALIPSGVAFAAMILVTAFNGFMAWRQETELLAVYAIIGGFATPLLLATGRDDEFFLFGYLLILNASVVALLSLRPWTRLLLLAFVGTVGFFVDWYVRFYAPAAFGTTAVFLALFFVLFAGAALFVRPREVALADTTAIRWPLRWQGEGPLRVLLCLANAAYGFLAFYAMLTNGGSSRAAIASTALAFAAFYIGLGRTAQRRLAAGLPTALAELQFAIAVAFLTIAIPLAIHGHWITIGWFTEGAALITLAVRLRSLQMRVLGLSALTLGLISLAIDLTEAQSTVILNARFATFLVAIAAMAVTAWLAQSAMLGAAPASPRPALWDVISWRQIGFLCGSLINLLIFVAVTFEIHTYWWSGPKPANHADLIDQRMFTQFTYSAWALLFGAMLLAAGFWRRLAPLRWQALVLLALGICKVFLVDTSQLSQGYRIVSFVGLGVLLLGVSFAYQKDWLQLRPDSDEVRPR